jgi:geranylgeranyl pyrophosphate synthase
MHSVVERDDLEAALASAVHRFDGASPVTEQLHHHFGYLGTAGTPGRRLRMQLVAEVFAAEGGTADGALDVGAALEILYHYALVHRDIADGDASRDGRAAVWKRYGIAHGINAGDALCAIAYLEVLTGCDRRPPERTLLMTHVLQEANYEMCAGQAADISFDAVDRVNVDAYLQMLEEKTGALFGAACQLGALEAGADEERARAYARLGRGYGIAAQIVADEMGNSKRRWTYARVAAEAGGPAPAAAVQRAIAAADVAATAAGIDADGRVRDYFARSILRTA